MNKFILAALTSALAAVGCASSTSGTSASVAQSVTSDTDSAGCGDGETSTPNRWDMSIGQGDTSGLFREVALMSSNLFQVSGATAVFDSTDLKFPQDVNAATALTFNVSFSPGVDSLGMPTIAEDSIKNRDTVLTQLSGMGVSILCNPIYAAEPLNGGSAGKNGAQPSTPDSVGCGDGVASTPNVWFMQIQKTDANAALFKDVALMASNLFIVRNIVAANSATKSGTQTFPVNVAETSALNFEVAFIQGNDSIAMPTMAKDSVANRDATLLQLAGDHVEIDCDEIGVGGPLGG